MNRISARVVADSKTARGHRITTMEVTFPRFILAEFNTHRMFSRNSASSRAIPFKKMLKTVDEQPFIPIAWQTDHSGMQGTNYLTEEEDIEYAIGTWLHARDSAVEEAKILHAGANVTKQLVNRMLEPYLYHKVLVTATEWDNFFDLRCPQYEYRLMGDENHGGHLEYMKSKREWLEFNELMARRNGGHNIGNVPSTDLDWLQINKGMGEIHIMDLAEKMYDALNESTPNILQPGEWHIPYGDMIDLPSTIPIENGYTLEEGVIQRKLKIAVARCARLSYQTLGDNPAIDYNKDFELFETLKESGHYSPFEHVGQAMSDEEYFTSIKGEAYDKKSYGWSNNFQGFTQFRDTLEKELNKG